MRLLAGLVAVAIAMGTAASADTLARKLFGAVEQPSNQQPAAIGDYSRGALKRARPPPQAHRSGA